MKIINMKATPKPMAKLGIITSKPCIMTDFLKYNPSSSTVVANAVLTRLKIIVKALSIPSKLSNESFSIKNSTKYGLQTMNRTRGMPMIRLYVFLFITLSSPARFSASSGTQWSDGETFCYVFYFIYNICRKVEHTQHTPSAQL